MGGWTGAKAQSGSSLAKAQAGLRYAYRSESVGQLYSGLVWLVSAVGWLVAEPLIGAVILFVGGFFIYPVTAGVCRLLGNPGSVPADSPLREASVTIPIVGPMAIPVAAAAGLYDVNWLYPAFMVVIGAHYLPFSHLYGMRVFLPLGAAIWGAGLAIAVWVPDFSVLGAVLTGAALLLVGVWAARAYKDEFGAAGSGSM